jgi:hypothetical protein
MSGHAYRYQIARVRGLSPLPNIWRAGALGRLRGHIEGRVDYREARSKGSCDGSSVAICPWLADGQARTEEVAHTVVGMRAGQTVAS